MELRLGFMASHGGTNMQAIIDACTGGALNAAPAVVISNNSRSMALVRARGAGVPGYHLSGKTHADPDRAVLEALRTHDVDIVILAGYMKKLGPLTLEHYRRRVLNIHPALLPKFGGQGMYGSAVHEAVLAAGEKVTGVTIHLVDECYDHGPTVAQCQVPVLRGDTVDKLAQRVLAREHEFFVETLKGIEAGEIDLDRVAGR